MRHLQGCTAPRGRVRPLVKKAVCATVLVAALAGVLFAAGCGTAGKSNGQSQGAGSAGEVSEASLGVPIYPGAQEDQERPDGMSPPAGQSAPQPQSSRPPFNGQSAPRPPGDDGRSRPVMLWTSDSVEQVVAWYRQNLSGKTAFSETTRQGGPGFGGGSGGADTSATMTVFSFELEEVTKTVMVGQGRQDKGGTMIVIGEAPQGIT